MKCKSGERPFFNKESTQDGMCLCFKGVCYTGKKWNQDPSPKRCWTWHMDHSVLKVLKESRCREASELPLLTCPKLQSHEKEASLAPTWKSNFYLQCLWTGVRRHHRKTFVNSPSLLPASHPSMPCPAYSCLSAPCPHHRLTISSQVYHSLSKGHRNGVLRLSWFSLSVKAPIIM